MATMTISCGSADNGDNNGSFGGPTADDSESASGSATESEGEATQGGGPTTSPGETDGPADDSSDDGPPPGGCGPVDPPPTTYDFGDDVPPSQDPPGGLAPEDVPVFVALGWDDNAYSGLEGSGGEGGMDWAVGLSQGRTNPAGSGNPATYDGTPISMTFYMTSTYIADWISESPTYVKRSWRAALDGGHELGNHTHAHEHGAEFTAMQWNAEIETCVDWLTRPFDPDEGDVEPNPAAGVGVPLEQLYGFRTPFLEYNDAELSEVRNFGFWYDASIEEGFEYDQDGSNYFWPYTLDGGSPGHEILVKWGLKEPITNHPGLWEMPVYAFIAPPDEVAEEYDFEPGLRDRLLAVQDWFDAEGGKITGFDYNLWVTFEMNKEDFLATLKYSLDLRREGNHAPFLIGTHTDYYSDKYTAPANSTAAERREAIEEFLDYALEQEDVRVVSAKQTLDWVRRPQPLGCE